MTDEKIIKAMHCVMGNSVDCSECAYRKALPFPSCRMMCAKNALDLINRQKTKNERLEKELMKCKLEKEMLYQNVEEIKSEAIKKFAEELKNYFSISECYLDIINIIDNLVKEMAEVETNQRKEDGKNERSNRNIAFIGKGD